MTQAGQPRGCISRLADDERDAFCDAEHGALMTLLLHPNGNAEQLARKARIIRDEGVWEFGEAKEVFERLAQDT